MAAVVLGTREPSPASLPAFGVPPPAVPLVKGPVPPKVIAVPEQGTAPPVLLKSDLPISDAQKATALRLAQEEPRLAQLLGGGFTLQQAGPWTTSVGPRAKAKPRRLLGVALVVHLNSPLSLTNAPMPSLLYDETEEADPPYQEYTANVTTEGTEDLIIVVDLTVQRVVSVSALPGQAWSAPLPPDVSRTVPYFENEWATTPVQPRVTGVQP
jgi:hypothetical protein